MSKINGFQLIFVLVCFILSTEGTPLHSSKDGVKKNEELDKRIAAFVLDIRALDFNTARHGDVQLEFQGNTTSKDKIDRAPERLFKYVDEKQIFSRPTYKALIELTSFYSADVNKGENKSAGGEQAEERFMDELMQTDIMQRTWKFLASEGKTSNSSIDDLRRTLTELWFGLYSRGTGAKGSSGFEHVFVGEWKKGEVSGLHNWIRYYLLEKDGKIDYKGYLLVDGQIVLNIRFDWGTYKKPIGGFFVGTSPEFDFAVLSTCYLLRQGTDACKFEFAGNRMAVTSFPLVQDGRTFIGTAYAAPL